MALKATKAQVWAVSIDDRAGGVADKLEPLAKAGANFEMVLARRTPENAGKGMLFVTPVKGAKAMRAAREAGMGSPETIYSVRIEGADRFLVLARRKPGERHHDLLALVVRGRREAEVPSRV